MDRLDREIGRELRRFGPAAEMAELLRTWPAAVGEGIARNAWPARFARDGSLVVHTADAVWAFELGQQAMEIAGRLGKLVPNGIKFVPGPVPEPSPETTAAAQEPPRAATLAEARQAAQWAAEVEDPELRELVARAARASLARAAADRRF